MINNCPTTSECVCSRTIHRTFFGRLLVRSGRLRFFEVAGRRVELVTAPRVAEPDDVAIVLGQRIRLYWLAGPGAGLVDAVGDVEVIHSIFLVRSRFSVVQISVSP